MIKRNDLICHIMTAFSRISLSLFYGLQTEGLEYLPREEAFVLLPKHQCWQDIPLMALATPRPLYYVAKYELFENRLSGWFLKSLGGIPLNRAQPLRSRGSIRAMVQFLKNGEAVVIFPEGTYYRNRMGSGKAGMVRLIVSRLSFPLIPVGIQYKRKGFRVSVLVRFGRPIFPNKKDSPQSSLDRVMKEIARLSGLL